MALKHYYYSGNEAVQTQQNARSLIILSSGRSWAIILQNFVTQQECSEHGSTRKSSLGKQLGINGSGKFRIGRLVCVCPTMMKESFHFLFQSSQKAVRPRCAAIWAAIAPTAVVVKFSAEQTSLNVLLCHISGLSQAAAKVRAGAPQFQA